MPVVRFILSLEDYIQMLRTSLIRRWKGAIIGGEVLPLCGMKDYKFIDSAGLRGRIKRNPLTSNPNDGFLLEVDNGPIECWVSPSLARRQYSKVFTEFLKSSYQIDYNAENGRRDAADKYQIDHAHCCESVRIKNDAWFVLITPVRQRINSGWATIEKFLANDGNRTVSTQVANYFTFAKLADVKPPSVAQKAKSKEESITLVNALKEFLDLPERDRDIESVAEFLEQCKRGAVNHRAKRSAKAGMSGIHQVGTLARIE